MESTQPCNVWDCEACAKIGPCMHFRACISVKDVGQSYTGKPHVRLDEGEKGSMAWSGRSLPQSRKADITEALNLNCVRLLSTLPLREWLPSLEPASPLRETRSIRIFYETLRLSTPIRYGARILPIAVWQEVSCIR